MNRIKQLSPHEAQKIAAGEVVERPANVVKELIENALDAGATAITIFIENAGKSLIRVIDNGHGMSPDDAQACFAHHATSKLTSVNELSHLQTFGFRGEALSSISAVSKVQLITKEEESVQAVKICMHGAQLQSHEWVTAATGTDIAVEHLFYNVPARKKFLKTDETEWRQIVLLFQAMSLAYPATHFKLYNNGTLHFNCPPATTAQERITQLWDYTIAAQLLPVNVQQETISITGCISNPTFSRFDRSAIFFFVNNRWVKNNGLSKALLKAYNNVLPAQKFPMASLALTIDTAQVDINIHPRKEEVQFINPRLIEHAITGACKHALEKNLSERLHKTVSLAPAASFASTGPARSFISSAPFPMAPLAEKHMRSLAPFSAAIPESLPAVSGPESAPPVPPTQAPLFTSMPESFIIIGQIHATYILIEHAEGLSIVDQHAAHERILYEQFAQRFENTAATQLLFPTIITLNASDCALIEKHASLFARHNIILEPFGADQIMITAVPIHIKEIALNEFIQQVIGWIKEDEHLDPVQFSKKIHEKMQAQMACKAAVKAGDILTQAQMKQLLADLYKTPNRFSCPHGRPTTWHITLLELEKKFKRKL